MKFLLEARQNRVDLFIYDTIGAGGIKAGDVIARLQGVHRNTEVVVHINSAGGIPSEGLAIFNILRQFPNLKTINEGLAGSIASVIFLAAKPENRSMFSNAVVMIHDPFFGIEAGGKIEEVEAALGFAKGTRDVMREIYHAEINASTEQIDQWLTQETYFFAQTNQGIPGVTEVGIASTILESGQLAATADLTKLLGNQTQPNTNPTSGDKTMDFVPWLKAECNALGLDMSKLSDDQRAKFQARYNTLQASTATPPPLPTENPVGAGAVQATAPAQAVAANTAVPVQGMAGGVADLRAENLRIGDIQAYAAEFDGELDEANLQALGVRGKTIRALANHAVREGWSSDRFELETRRASRPSLDQLSAVSPHAQFAIHSADTSINNQAMSASLLRSMGTIPNRERNPHTGREYGLEIMFAGTDGVRALEDSHLPQYQIGNSIQALLDLQIRAAGMYYGGVDRKSTDFVATALRAHTAIRAAASGAAGANLDVLNVLENTMHKAALAAFEGVEAIWRFIAGRMPLNDFRPHNMYRLDYEGKFKQVGTTGQLKHIEMVDGKSTIQADTFGAMISVDRKTIRNDDLNMVLAKARGLGVLGAQRIEESVMVLLLSNAGSFFSVGNKNLISGADSELNNVVEGKGLDLARQTFRNHVVNGHPIGVSPRILIVGTTRETTANRLFTEERIGDTGPSDNFVNNPHVGLYRPYVTPYLNNTDITDQDGAAITGQSDTQWFLGAEPNIPQGSAINIGFLDGRDTPFFDEAASEFSVPEGLVFRSYLDWGVAFNTERTQLMLKSAGV